MTLSGQVSAYEDQWTIKHIALSVAVVNAVRSQIIVAPPESSAQSNAQISRALERALRQLAYFLVVLVKVSMRQFWKHIHQFTARLPRLFKETSR